MDPETSVQFLRGVGPARARLLAKLGILTIAHLVRKPPRTHEDRRVIEKIGRLRPETHATVRGRVKNVRIREFGRGRKVVVTAAIDDGSGVVVAEFWQQRFRAEQLSEG